MDSLLPMYVFMLLFSVSLVSFHLGKYQCNQKKVQEYIFFPRTQEELEKYTTASDSLKHFL